MGSTNPTSNLDSATELANRTRQKVAEIGHEASDKLDEKRSSAADTLEHAASTIHERAGSLPGGEKVASVAHTAANKLESTADYVRQHDFQAMMDDLVEVVKRHPGPALASAAVVGFLLGRAVRND